MKDIMYKESWNLDTIFPGESQSNQLKKHLDDLEDNIKQFVNKLKHVTMQIDVHDAIILEDVCKDISIVRTHLSHAQSFITCLLAQNPQDNKATSLQVRVAAISSSYELAIEMTQHILVTINDDLWESFMHTKELSNYSFQLNKWRNKGQLEDMDNIGELLANLKVDGYHGWGQMYDMLINDIKVPMTIKGEMVQMSVGQAINLRSHSCEEVRKEAHKTLQHIWSLKQDLFAKLLNHIIGFRIKVDRHKGVNNFLEIPLLDNHMKEETLTTMWEAVEKHKQPFKKYLNKKAVMFGEEKLHYYNFWAPLPQTQSQLNYEDAVIFVIQHLGKFGPELENFCRKSFEKGWVESQNRPNKKHAAFCASFPLTKESRVFLTYDGTIGSVLTMAHELGHALHNDAMKNMNGINKQYPLSIAETASTFAEMIMLDAAIESANSDKERLILLDEKIKRSVMNFMNIHARFLFEKRIHLERENGYISSAQLNDFMEEAINESYQGSITDIPTHMWIWAPHFYKTKAPFYNFPYTFGYLLSLHIYAKAKHEGKGFEKKYLALLRDSGSFTVEDLIKKHLDEDVTSEKFWEQGLELCIKDVEQFIRLSEIYKE